MALLDILPSLENLPQYRGLIESLTYGNKSTGQIISNGLPYLISCLRKELNVPVLVLVPKPDDSRRLQDQLISWQGDDGSILHFPESDSLPFERHLSDRHTVQERLSVLSTLVTHSGNPLTIVSSISAVAQFTLNPQTLLNKMVTLIKGQSLNIESLIHNLVNMGYQLEPSVEIPGTISRRGGILDIFPATSVNPYRIELYGNQIDSMRTFDPLTQVSIEQVNTVYVNIAQEILPAFTDTSKVKKILSKLDMSECNKEHRDRINEEISSLIEGYYLKEVNLYTGFFCNGTIIDYMPSNSLLVMYQPSYIEDFALKIDTRTSQFLYTKTKRGELPLNFPSGHIFWPKLIKILNKTTHKLDLSEWGTNITPNKTNFSLPFKEAPSFFGKMDDFSKRIQSMSTEGKKLIVVTQHAKRLKGILKEHQIVTSTTKVSLSDNSAKISLIQGDLEEGFSLTMKGINITLITDREIFDYVKRRRSIRRAKIHRDAFLSEITPGDFVVHIEHGIARFLNTEERDMGTGLQEYLILEYADNDKLYVPMEQLDRVTAYISPLEVPAKVTRLGNQEWNRTKIKVARSAKEMAAELLSLYASREIVNGIASLPDSSWQKELEDSFPFEETLDQIVTINEVKEDMEQSKPMDRLVCGDVGYGKTEVALRAAFKAVMSSMQVAILVPTTVLAEQHYLTFSQRLKPFPIGIETLSRFRTNKEQKDILEDLRNGKVDICIGTHRLLQKDVLFNNLGLVIIDEEQRFGVDHKERFKKMRKEVDVLALSATPIPRTLHMSLSGVRDMSTIETPPEQRIPIKTYVSEYSNDVIRDAILRELDRQGQVFFVHNRVHNIDSIANSLTSMVPEARISVAHGRMPEGQLQDVMRKFSQGKADVLVCTTIIESGLDIPGVNTLIVNRADRFGLSQLYQLRGRIGRGSERAYAYFLIPQGRRLTETAEKRLKSILAATELGSGFRIAMQDLEIRGAGSLLGREQSGHIQAVGFDLYTRILSEAVMDLRFQQESIDDQSESKIVTTEKLLSNSDINIEIGIPASLPQDYISDLSNRLGIYKRLVIIEMPEVLDTIANELTDRFGPMPWQVKNLLYLTKLKLLSREANVKSIYRHDKYIDIRMLEEIGGAKIPLEKFLGPNITIGNKLIKFDTSRLKNQWEQLLEKLLLDLMTFRKNLLELKRTQ